MDDLSISTSAARVLGAAADNKAGEARAALAAGRDDEAAQRFEALLASLLVRELRKTLPDGLFQGAGAETYEGWFDDHLGEALAASDALGLAGVLKVALSRGASEEGTE